MYRVASLFLADPFFLFSRTPTSPCVVVLVCCIVHFLSICLRLRKLGLILPRQCRQYWKERTISVTTYTAMGPLCDDPYVLFKSCWVLKRQDWLKSVSVQDACRMARRVTNRANFESLLCVCSQTGPSAPKTLSELSCLREYLASPTPPKKSSKNAIVYSERMLEMEQVRRLPWPQNLSEQK